MTTSTTQRDATEHQQVWLQIPWYVNESIDAQQRQRIDAHLRNCAECRAELLQQRAVQTAMVAEVTVEHMPSAALNRLRQRLDAAPVVSRDDEAATNFSPRVTPRQTMLAACVALVATALAVAVIASRHGTPSAAAADAYYTVSSATPRPAGEIIRAVFAPTTTVSQLQRLLDEAHLKIIAGPSEAGVYSLAATRAQPVADALSQLRRHADVRFAEATAAPAARGDR